MTDQDPIHTDCGFEVGDSGDSHLRAEPFPLPNHLEPIRCGDDDCLKLIRPGDKYHVENGTVYCDECFKSESA